MISSPPIRYLLAGYSLLLGLTAAALGVLYPGGDVFGLPPGLAAAAVAVGALLAGGAALEARLHPLLKRFAAHPVALLIGVLCFAAGAWIITRLWFGWKLLALALAFPALLIAALRDDASDRLVLLSLGGLVAGLVLRQAFMLAEFIWTDEGFHLSAAYSMLNGGPIGPAMMYFPDDLPVAPWRGYAFLIYGLRARVFGLGLLPARIMANLIGVVALPFFFGAVKHLYDRRAAFMATAFLSLSMLFIYTINGRTDSLPMLAVAVTLYVFARARRAESLWWHAAVGAVAVLALETHFVNAVVLVAWGVFYAAEYVIHAVQQRRLLRADPLWYFLLGAVPVVALYAVLHLAPLPPSIVEDSASIWEVSRRFAVVRNRFGLYWGYAPFDLVVLIGALAAALLRGDRVWLLLVGGVLLGDLALGTDATIAHTAYLLPILFMGSGAVISGWDGARWVPAPLLIFLLLGLTGSAVGKVRAHSAISSAPDPIREASLSAVREHTQPGDPLLSTPYMVPFLIDRHQIYLHNYGPGVFRGPVAAGEDPDLYWQRILIEEWPTAYIADHRINHPPMPIQLDYMAARAAVPVTEYVSVVGDGIAAPLEAIDHTAAVSLVGYTREAGQLVTLWAIREPLAGGIGVEAVTAEGAVVAEGRLSAGATTFTRLSVTVPDHPLTLRITAGCGAVCHIDIP